MTIAEMAKELNLKPDAIRRRLWAAGIKPFCKDALYTVEDFEAIKVVKPQGWPRKEPSDEAPKPKNPVGRPKLDKPDLPKNPVGRPRKPPEPPKPKGQRGRPKKII